MLFGRNNDFNRQGAIAPAAAYPRRRAFTLVEMIIVLTLMVIAIGIAAPSFRAFMSGRNVDNEAQRFQSLTRYAASRAITEGLPMDLGIDIKGRRYWVAGCGGYTETSTNVVGFTLDQDVQMSVVPGANVLTTVSNVWTPYLLYHRGNSTVIRFQPDGLVCDLSPQTVKFRQLNGTEPETWVVQNPNHRTYDLSPGHPRSTRF